MSGYRVYLNKDDVDKLIKLKKAFRYFTYPGGNLDREMGELFDKLLGRQDQSESHLKSGAKLTQKRQ